MRYTLTPHEQARARADAARRISETTHATDRALGDAKAAVLGGEQRIVENEVDAAGAELAVAVVTGQPWTAEGAASYCGDVGTDEVRFTRYRTGHLPISPPRDRINCRYWLVTGAFPTYTIAGWRTVTADMLAGYPLVRLNPAGRQCHAIPQADLLPFSEGCTAQPVDTAAV